MKKNSLVLLRLVIAVLCFSTVASAQDNEKYLYQVEVPLVKDAIVQATTPDGKVFRLGQVLALPEKSRWPSYTASAWGKPATVTASAVNAIHLLVSIEKGGGRTISLVPHATIAPAAGPGASIVIETKAGTGLFGAWAPPTGTIVKIMGANGKTRLLSESPLPKEGETLIFRVMENNVPYYVEFENRPGGRVIAWSKEGENAFARVLKPVQGVGRFEGTLFQDIGRIRASHAGVVDVSTSPYGVIGGFQIIPWDHALKSKEMQGAWQMSQWMILAPIDGKSMMGGQPPLFGGGLIPGNAEGEELWDFWSTYGRRPLVLCRINGGSWQKLPNVAGRVDDGIKEITHLRIYFPITEEPAQ